MARQVKPKIWVNAHEDRMEVFAASLVTHLNGIKLRLGEIVKLVSQSTISQAMLDQMDKALTENTQGILDAQKESVQQNSPAGTERSLTMPTTVQEVINEIARQTTIVAGLKVYNDDLRQRLRDAMAAGQLVTPEQLDAIFAETALNSQGIADAMVDNVPVP